MPASLQLTVFPGRYAIYRLPPDAVLPSPPPEGFWTVTRTPDEVSVVTLQSAAPLSDRCERGFRTLKVEGPLDFSLVGILADLTRALAEVRVSLFAISTFDTDYLLVREADLDIATAALRSRGHRVAEAASPGE